MSHQEFQPIIPRSQRSPTAANSAPKVLYSAGLPAQHKCLNGVKDAAKSSREVVEGVLPEGIPMEIFNFADCVLAKSVSEGPAGRREILFQENDESPVKGQSRAQKEEEFGQDFKITPFMELQKLYSAPELQEMPGPSKSPSHQALTSLLNMILSEQTEDEEQAKSRGKTPEKTRETRALSINLVNKFAGLQKGNSHNSSQTSLHDRSNSNLLSGDRTTEKSSRINTEPPSKLHSRAGSFGKITIGTQPDIIWETTEVESGTIYRRRTSRLSANYSYLARQYEDYPLKPVELPEEPNTPTLSPKRLNTEGNTPAKKYESSKKSPKKSPKKAASRDFGSRIKSIKSKLFPVKPQSLHVKTTWARWPVVSRE